MDKSAYRIHQGVYTDFTEESMKTQGSPLELRKLDGNHFCRSAYTLHSEGFSIIRSGYTCRLLVTSDNPSNLPTFGIPMHPSLFTGWHGRRIEGNNSLIVIPPTGKIDAIINPGFDLFGISCSEELLQAKICELGIGRLQVMLGRTNILDCDPEQLRVLQQLLMRVAEESVSREVDLAKVKDQVLSQLILVLNSHSWERKGQGRKSSRCAVIKQTERYVLAHPDEAPKMKHLCEYIGVSRRTLNYAFSACLDMTPKAYIKAIRLNAVHKILRTNRAGSQRVSDAANVWGFWHMGQFAKDYRHLFGELPSETLATEKQYAH